RGETALTRADMLKLLQETYSYLPYAKRLEKLKRRIIYLLEPLEQKRAREIQTELEAHPDNNRATQAELKRISRARVRDEMQPIYQRIGQLTAIDTLSLYRDLFAKPKLLRDLAEGIDLPEDLDR